MTQRKCGTCRYFEDSGLAASGTCCHPLRRDLQDLVLVRKNELGCRDGRHGVLWESVADGEPAEPVLAGAGAVSRSSAPSPLPTPSPVLGQSAGQADHSIDAPAVSRAPREDARSVVADRDSVIIHHHPSYNRPQPVAASHPVMERAVGANVPDNRARANMQESAAVRTPTDRTVPPTSHPASGGAPMSTRERLGDAMAGGSRQPTPQYGVRPSDEVRTATGAPIWGFARGERVAGDGPARSVQDDGRPASARPEQRVDVVSTGNERHGSTEPFTIPTAFQETDRGEATIDMQAAELDDLEPPVEPRLPGVPQCCSTCRDFRPADRPGHGWCNNPHAFDHQQLVRADDLACQHTFGNWWTPSDDWWLLRADISHHSRPTPYVDEYLRKLLREDVRRQR